MMKTIFNTFIFTLFAGIFLSCYKTHEGDLVTDKDVSIISLEVNGFQASIDDIAQTIKVLLPWSNDLTATTINAVLPQDAILSPAITNLVDLSNGKTYRLYNGNLYWEYTVTAEHPTITNFSIKNPNDNKDYKGVVDDANRVITLKYPIGENLTSLSPIIAVAEGVRVSPSSGVPVDFSTPVPYTLSYGGESITYRVEVIPTSFTPVGFLGEAANASAISNDDEKEAYQWFSANVPNAKYISFDDVSKGKVDLSEYKVIWWHLDTDGGTLPNVSIATDVVSKLKTWYENGGSFFFSTWATQYVAPLGIAKDGKIPNNIFAQTEKPNAIGGDWGIYFGGNETHPIFKGLNLKQGTANVAMLLSDGTKAKNHSAVWNFEWGDYERDIPAWTANNGAVSLASWDWNVNMTTSVIFEYPKRGNSGKVICIGVGAYDWFNEDNSPENRYRTNIERLTSNILEYLAN